MTKKNHFHTIIIGGGTMGLATAYHLAAQGKSVLVLEQFEFLHEKGAHSGHNRVIRKAYFEHPDYVPLLLRAYENWKTLEEKTQQKIYHETGIIYFGEKGDTLLENTKASAQQYHLPLDIVPMHEAKAKYPIFDAISDDWECLFEPEAGFLDIKNALYGFVNEAMKNGAILQAHEKVNHWQSTDNTIFITTEKGEYSAEKLVITAGAWANELLDLPVQLKVTRQILGWVKPTTDTEQFMLGNCPVWFVSDAKQGLYYGKPILPDSIPMGFKVGAHHHGKIVNPNDVDRNISAEDIADFKIALEKYIPKANGETLVAKTCLYANSPDENFMIDFLPEDKNVIFACGFSGHGFKFASVIGEILADMAIKSKTDFPIDFLSVKRFLMEC